MNREQESLEAVQIFDPGDQFTLNAAKSVQQEKLPASVSQETERAELSMGDALQVRSAHYWLALGEVDQALLELGALSTSASNHPLAVKARVAVLHAARSQNEATDRE